MPCKCYWSVRFAFFFIWHQAITNQTLNLSQNTRLLFAEKAFEDGVYKMSICSGLNVLIFLAANINILDMSHLPANSSQLVSRSLGLAIPPRIRFLQKEEKRRQQQQNQAKKDAEVDEIFARVAAIEKKQALKESRAEKAAAEQERKQKLLDKSEEKLEEESSDEDSEEEKKSGEESDSEDETEEVGDESGNDSEGDSEDDSDENESESGVAEMKLGDSEARLAFDVGDDDLEDILTVKSKGAVNPAEDDDEEEEDLLTKVVWGQHIEGWRPFYYQFYYPNSNSMEI